MRNQESITKESVFSEVLYVVFLDLPETAACDSERCPDVHLMDKIKDKTKILSDIFFLQT